MKSGTGILPVGFVGIGILPMIHGLEAHVTKTIAKLRLTMPPCECTASHLPSGISCSSTRSLIPTCGLSELLLKSPPIPADSAV